MDSKEFSIGVVLLENAYSSFKISESPQKMDLWFEMLCDIDIDTFKHCIKSHIQSIKFPPTIASLRELAGPPLLSETEAWSCLSKALRNSTYNARSEWEQLPESIRRIVPASLMREWAALGEAEVGTVIHSNFIKSYRQSVADPRRTALSATGNVVQLPAGLFKEVNG